MNDDTLHRIKTKVRAALIRRLDSNSGMADALTFYYANYGDWRKLFTSIDDTDKVTADDVMRVAKEYLIPETRTVAYTVPPATAPGAPKPRNPEGARNEDASLIAAALRGGNGANRSAPRRSCCLPTRI